MSKDIYMAIDYKHANGKMRAMAVMVPSNRNFKAAIDEDIYIKNAFYISVCENLKEMNRIVELWNEQHEEDNRLMAWDELMEIIK